MENSDFRRRKTGGNGYDGSNPDIKLGTDSESMLDKASSEFCKSLDVDPLITEVLNHIKRISLHVCALFVFYILGRFGLFWTTLFCSTMLLFSFRKLEVLYRKVEFILKYFLPKETNVVNEKHVWSRPRDLPRWVRFPDEESVHWLNNIISALWPLISYHADSLIRAKIQPALDEKTPAKLKPVSLHELDFGSISPLVGSIQVYDEEFTKRDEIIMDMELYYAGNCNFTATIKDRVAAKLSDVQVYGHCRVVLSPLTKQIPLVDAMKFYLTRAPQIFWRGKKLLYILEMPKISDMIMEQVIDQLANFVIFPNAIDVQIRDKSKDKFCSLSPIADGVLRIALRGARNLVNKDTFGKSDPYCVTIVGSTTFKTKVVDDNLNPVWNEFYEVPIYNAVGLDVDFYLFDEDVNHDESLGNVSIPVAQIKQEGFIDMTNTLLDIKKGELQVQLQYCQLVPAVNPATVEDMEEPLKIDVAALTERSSSEITEFFGTTNNGVQATQPFNQCYINVFVDSATNLPRNHPTDLRAYPSPYVKITIPGFAGEKQTTIIKDMSNPVWEECFDFLANNTGDKTIKFEVFDSEKNTQTDGQAQAMIGQATSMLNTVGLVNTNHRSLGHVKVALSDVLQSPNLTMEMPFSIQGGIVDAQLLLKITVRFLLKSDPYCVNEENNLQERVEDTVDGHPGRETVDQLSETLRHDEQGAIAERDEFDDGRSQSHYGGKNSGGDYGTLGRGIYGRLSRKGSIRSVVDAIPASRPRLFLIIKYVKQHSQLLVQVDKADSLMSTRLAPYVEVKLKPDGIKKHTDVVKVVTSHQGSIPSLSMSHEVVRWNKTLVFTVPQIELSNKILQAKLKNHAAFPRSDTCFGYVSIPLYTMPLEAPYHSWFIVTPKPVPTPMY